LGPIHGNDVPTVDVTFFGRLEDRNEPGSHNGANEGSLIDRYHLQVFNAAGTTLLQEVGPQVITRGNLQIHTTSCN
jgi:hypothetical protein